MPEQLDSSIQEGQDQGKTLSFHLAEKHDILVVSLIGAITKTTEEILRQCNDQIAKSSAHSVVLNFMGVEKFDKPGVPEFVKLQLVVRRKPAQLRVCFLKPAIAAFLNDAGVLRPAEVSPDLKEAIVSLAFKRAA